MGQTKLALEFLKMKIGKQITFAPDAPIYCPHCAAHGRRIVVAHQDATYQAKYIGREQNENRVMCDVLYIFIAPMCEYCGREISKIYFPCR